MMIPTQFDLPLSGLDWLEFYPKHNVFHPGIDLNKGKGNQDLGQKVVAPKHGFVVYVSPKPTYFNRYNGGFGWFVIIQHDDGNYTRYAHLNDVTTSQGKEVGKGKTIAHVGNTGTTYAHLHFEVFNEEMALMQNNHWRKWCFYPGGKTQSWIKQFYINPWEWLDNDGLKEWQKKALEWGVENGVTNGDRPLDQATRVDVIEMIRKYDSNNN